MFWSFTWTSPVLELLMALVRGPQGNHDSLAPPTGHPPNHRVPRPGEPLLLLPAAQAVHVRDLGGRPEVGVHNYSSELQGNLPPTFCPGKISLK